MFSRMGIHMAAACSSLILLMTTGTIVYRYLEDWTWIQSLYFSVVTLTTVGYGDLHPTSDASRLFTVGYILLGVSIALAATAVIGRSYLKRREDKILMKREVETYRES